MGFWMNALALTGEEDRSAFGRVSCALCAAQRTCPSVSGAAAGPAAATPERT